MKKQKLLPFILFFFCFQFSFSQNPLVKQWDKRFGGISYEELYAFKQTIDGGYILGGWSQSDSSGDKTQINWGFYPDYWIVKTDSLGNKQWDKHFGGTHQDILYDLQQTTDKGYILGGRSMSSVSGDKTQPNWDLTLPQPTDDYWIVKTDSFGVKQWDKRFGGTSEDWFYSLEQTSDGGYIIGGASFSNNNGDKSQPKWGGYDYWIVKINSLGTKQWDKRFGGLATDNLISLEQTTDGGYILGGNSFSGIYGDKTQANWDTTENTSDYWIVKINSSGVKQWDKRFGGTSKDYFHSIRQTSDGGYVLAGISYSGVSGDKTQASSGGWDYWIVKVDANGNKQWDKDFGGSDDENRDFFENNFGNITQTTDGGYLIAGNSLSPISGDKTENNLGDTEGWIVKTDTMGNKLWDKTILITGAAVVGEAIQTQDGGYAIGTFTNSGMGGYKTQPNWSSGITYYDYWVIKFDNCATTQIPEANFTSNVSSVCLSNCVTFYDYSDCYSTRQWLFQGGNPSTSTLQSPVICYPMAGDFTVTLIATNLNGSDTLVKNNYIHVHPMQPTIAQAGNTLTSSTAFHYYWFLSDSLLNGATSQQFTALVSGYYRVCIMDQSGCMACSDSVFVNVNGIIESDFANSVLILPNPFSSEISITIQKQNVRQTSVCIKDVFGRTVFQSEIRNPKSAIELSFLQNGIYFLEVSVDENRVVKKIVKQ